MHICIVTNEIKYFYSHRYELAKFLISYESAKVTVITDISNKEIYNLISSSGINFYHNPKRNDKRKIASSLLFIKNLNKILNQNFFSVILFVGIEVSLLGMLSTLIIKNKIPSIYLISGIDSFFNYSVKKYFFRSSYKFLIKKNLRNYPSSTLLFQNQDDKKEMSSFLGLECDFPVIYGNGIQDVVTKKYKDLKKVSFIFASKINSSKGVQHFLNAAKHVVEKYPDQAEFIVAGEINNAFKKEITDLSELNIIRYKGDLTKKELYKNFKLADVFVLMSDREGLPMAALEAGAHGLPIIGTNINGLKECVIDGQTGFLINKDTYELINKCVFFILHKGKIGELGLNSRNYIYSRYSIKKIGKEYISLFKDLVYNL